MSLGSNYIEWLPRSPKCRAVNDDRSANDVAKYGQGFCVPECDVERLRVPAAFDAILRSDQRFRRHGHHGFYFFTCARILIITKPATTRDQHLAEWASSITVAWYY